MQKLFLTSKQLLNVLSVCPHGFITVAQWGSFADLIKVFGLTLVHFLFPGPEFHWASPPPPLRTYRINDCHLLIPAVEIPSPNWIWLPQFFRLRCRLASILCPYSIRFHRISRPGMFVEGHHLYLRHLLLIELSTDPISLIHVKSRKKGSALFGPDTVASFQCLLILSRKSLV